MAMTFEVWPACLDGTFMVLDDSCCIAFPPFIVSIYTYQSMSMK